MKKVALTVAVLALGLAACNKTNADNNAANETAVENAAITDVNAATTTRPPAADTALNAAGNAVENAGNAVDNAQDAVATPSTTHSKLALHDIQERAVLPGGPFFVRSLKVVACAPQ